MQRSERRMYLLVKHPTPKHQRQKSQHGRDETSRCPHPHTKPKGNSTPGERGEKSNGATKPSDVNNALEGYIQCSSAHAHQNLAEHDRKKGPGSDYSMKDAAHMRLGVRFIGFRRSFREGSSGEWECGSEERADGAAVSRLLV